MKTKNIIKSIFISLGTVFVFNKYISYKSNINNTFKKDNYKSFESIFGNIKYTEKGTGKPLLLIHNLSEGDNINEWNYITDYLSNENKVYSLNLLGCGNSNKDNIIYTNFMYSRLIADFIKKVIKDKSIIITSGNSNYIAVSTEIYEKGLIDKIIMINPAKPTTLNYNKIFIKLIKLPLIGTLIYNYKFSKRKMLKNLDKNYRIYEYINSKYDSIHYDKDKSKYLYASIVEGKTDINYENYLSRINLEIYSYIDNKHTYPHIEKPEKVFKYIKNYI